MRGTTRKLAEGTASKHGRHCAASSLPPFRACRLALVPNGAVPYVDTAVETNDSGWMATSRQESSASRTPSATARLPDTAFSGSAAVALEGRPWLLQPYLAHVRGGQVPVRRTDGREGCTHSHPRPTATRCIPFPSLPLLLVVLPIPFSLPHPTPASANPASLSAPTYPQFASGSGPAFSSTKLASTFICLPPPGHLPAPPLADRHALALPDASRLFAEPPFSSTTHLLYAAPGCEATVPVSLPPTVAERWLDRGPLSV